MQETFLNSPPPNQNHAGLLEILIALNHSHAGGLLKFLSPQSIPCRRPLEIIFTPNQNHTGALMKFSSPQIKSMQEPSLNSPPPQSNHTEALLKFSLPLHQNRTAALLKSVA